MTEFPANSEKSCSSQRWEDWLIRWPLTLGLIMSCALILGGIALALYSGNERIHEFPSFATLPQVLARWDGQGLLFLGLAVLLATPAVRLGGLFLSFLIQKDYRAAVCTVGVIGVLVFGLVLMG